MDIICCILVLFLALVFLFYLGHRRHNTRTSNRGSAIPTSYDREMTGLHLRIGNERNPQFSTYTDGNPPGDSSMQRTNDKVSKLGESKKSSITDCESSRRIGFYEHPSPSEGKPYYLRDRIPSPLPSGPDSLEETHSADRRRLSFLTSWSPIDPLPAAPPSSPISILKRPSSPLTISPLSGSSSGWLQTIDKNSCSSATQDSMPMCVGEKAEGKRKEVRFGEDQVKEIERVPEELRTRPKREAILLGMGKV